MRVLQTYAETISDGIGLRYSIYFAGCRHYCHGCHNPESWRADRGNLLTEAYFQQIIAEINGNPLLDGVTLSGGDPFYDPEALLSFIKRLKSETKQNIWCYTGYTYEELLLDPVMKASLAYIDVLVDGKFVREQMDPTLYFRGSKNQRVLLLHDGKIVKELYFPTQGVKRSR